MRSKDLALVRRCPRPLRPPRPLPRAAPRPRHQREKLSLLPRLPCCFPLETVPRTGFPQVGWPRLPLRVVGHARLLTMHPHPAARRSRLNLGSRYRQAIPAAERCHSPPGWNHPRVARPALDRQSLGLPGLVRSAPVPGSRRSSCNSTPQRPAREPMHLKSSEKQCKATSSPSLARPDRLAEAERAKILAPLLNHDSLGGTLRC